MRDPEPKAVLHYSHNLNPRVAVAVARHLDAPLDFVLTAPRDPAVRDEFGKLNPNALVPVPHVPTSNETAPPGNLSSDGRRMDFRFCRNHPVLLAEAIRRRMSVKFMCRGAGRA